SGTERSGTGRASSSWARASASSGPPPSSSGALVPGEMLAALLALVAAGSLFAGWLLVKRPLEVLAWVARRSLGRAGLKKVVVQSLVGPQTAFVGGSGPALVLLHGAGDHAGTWFHVAPSLPRRCTIVLQNLAGRGSSGP